MTPPRVPTGYRDTRRAGWLQPASPACHRSGSRRSRGLRVGFVDLGRPGRVVRRLMQGVPALVLLLTGQVAGAAAPDYRQLDDVLVRNVRNGYVDYDGIRADPAFGRFVRQLATTTPADLPDRADQLAFYINAYNALAIQGILNGDSPATRLSRAAFFRRRTYEVLGTAVTLDTIEKERLAAFGEPRVHFAIVCASLGCPRLAARAYRPETVEVQLDAAARAFINDPTRNRFDGGRRLALLSQIFEWYEADFTRVAGSVPAYLAGYVRDPGQAAGLAGNDWKLQYIPYDWNLNGTWRANAR